MAEGDPKFIQIAAVEKQLFALDEAGQVWRYRDSELILEKGSYVGSGVAGKWGQCWTKVPMIRGLENRKKYSAAEARESIGL